MGTPGSDSDHLLTKIRMKHLVRILGPLIFAVFVNALCLGMAGLTGPVGRGDAGTVRKHVDALILAAPEAADAYVALARLTADRALAAGLLKPEQAERLLDALGGNRWT